MAINMAAVFNAEMAIYTAAGPVYMYKIDYLHGSNFSVQKQVIYTVAGPTYNYGYIQYSRFQCKTAIYIATGSVKHIHGYRPTYKNSYIHGSHFQ